MMSPHSPQTTVFGPLSSRLQCWGHWQLAEDPSRLATQREKLGQSRLEQGSLSPGTKQEQCFYF